MGALIMLKDHRAGSSIRDRSELDGNGGRGPVVGKLNRERGLGEGQGRDLDFVPRVSKLIDHLNVGEHGLGPTAWALRGGVLPVGAITLVRRDGRVANPRHRTSTDARNTLVVLIVEGVRCCASYRSGEKNEEHNEKDEAK